MQQNTHLDPRAMAAASGGPWPVPTSLPPPRPKSPPAYPDLHGKRRQLLKAQMLERDAVYLEEELKFVQGLQPASLGCKEVVEFVTASSDPLMPTTTGDQGAICFDDVVSWIRGCRKPCCLSVLPKCDCPSPYWSTNCCCFMPSSSSSSWKGCFCNWCSEEEVGCNSLVPSLKWPGMSCPDCFCKFPNSPRLNINCFGCCRCKRMCWNPLSGCFCCW